MPLCKSCGVGPAIRKGWCAECDAGSERDAEFVSALVRTAPVTTRAASIEQNPISPEQSNQSGKGE